MSLIQYITNITCYSMSLSTLCTKLNMTPSKVLNQAKKLQLNVFSFEDEVYIGTKQGLIDYNQDKLIGQNPFHQTY